MKSQALNAASRIQAAQDNTKKAVSTKLGNQLERSFKAAGHTVNKKENKLINRRLSGPAWGNYFSIETDATFTDTVDMIEDAGWVRSRDRTKSIWNRRGEPSIVITRSGQSTYLYF